MGSKLGVHVNDIIDGNALRDFHRTARPVIAKTIAHDAGFWREVKAEHPQLFLVARRYVEKQPLLSPESEADSLARWILDASLAGVADAWEGYNESSRGQLPERCRFDRRLAMRLHEGGLKYVCGSWSVGVPDLPDWQRGEMLDALRVADYIGVHEYCAPRMDDARGLIAGSSPQAGWFTLRYRLWYPLLPPDCRKPLLITECGIDSGAAHWDPGKQGGWRSFTTARGYLEQLAWYDSHLQADPYVGGATIFCDQAHDPRWRTHDLQGECELLLRDYIVSQRTAPPPPPPPTPTPETERMRSALRDIVARAKEGLGE